MTSTQRLALAGLLLLGTPSVWAASCPDTLDHEVRPLNGGDRVNLCDAYLGKVVLVVNTASYCGFTSQYEGLEALYRDYRDRGLVVIGFPSNDFGGQEPGTEKQIQEFCRLTYGVQFPMYEKTHASKRKATGIYRVLGERAGEYPRWNFHKYLIDRDGQLAGSFQSAVRPQSKRLVNAVEGLL